MNNHDYAKHASKKSEKIRSINKPLLILYLSLAGVIVAWLLWGFFGVSFFAEKLGAKRPIALENLGQTGDLFGGINALFAALAFVGVGFAAYYQKETYLQQKKDSEDNKEALARSNATNAVFLSNANHELFINVFLRLMEELQKTVKNLEVKKSIYENLDAETTDIGIQQIETQLSEIGLHLDHVKWNQERFALAKIEIEKLYWRVFTSNSKTLRPFFNNFYQTFLLIDESGISYSQQDRYAQIALASIDEKFMMLIMMNGLTNKGQRLKELVEKYGLLEKFSGDARGAKANELASYFYLHTAFLPSEEREVFYDPKNTMEKREAKQLHELTILNQRLKLQAELQERVKAEKISTH